MPRSQPYNDNHGGPRTSNGSASAEAPWTGRSRGRGGPEDPTGSVFGRRDDHQLLDGADGKSDCMMSLPLLHSLTR